MLYDPIAGLLSQLQTQVASGTTKAVLITTISDVKGTGTAGGTALAQTSQIRTLNTISGDFAAMGISLNTSDNSFALPAGNWFIQYSAPALAVQYHQAFLSTGASVVNYGTEEFTNSTVVVSTRSEGSFYLQNAVQYDMKLSHFTETLRNADGLGPATAGRTGNTATSGIFSLINIYKTVF